MSSQINFHPLEFGFFRTEWERCHDQRDSALLRLALLRDLARELHADQSRALVGASRWKPGASPLPTSGLDLLGHPFPQVFLRRQADTEIIRSEKTLENFLRRLHALRLEPIDSAVPLQVPHEFEHAIPKQKLNRSDRAWEATLVQEGLALGWTFLQYWKSVPVPEIEAWNAQFCQALWPRGIVLFIDSPETVSRPSPDVSPPHWQGVWYLIANPESTIQIQDSFPGVWKLLFPLPPSKV